MARAARHAARAEATGELPSALAAELKLFASAVRFLEFPGFDAAARRATRKTSTESSSELEHPALAALGEAWPTLVAFTAEPWRSVPAVADATCAVFQKALLCAKAPGDRSVLGATISALLLLSAPKQLHSVRHWAGACLGAVGAIEPSALQLSPMALGPPAAGAEGGLASRCAQQPTPRRSGAWLQRRHGYSAGWPLRAHGGERTKISSTPAEQSRLISADLG